MTENHASLAHFYDGWDVYQQQLTGAIAPLSPDQLALRAAPHLRSIGEIATHIIAVRARWFHSLMGEGGADMSAIEVWDRKDAPVRSAAELVHGFEATWLVIQEVMTRGSSLIVNNAALVKQVAFPLDVLPIKTIPSAFPETEESLFLFGRRTSRHQVPVPVFLSNSPVVLPPKPRPADTRLPTESRSSHFSDGSEPSVGTHQLKGLVARKLS